MKIIKYQLETEINYGTPEEPDIETLLSPVTVTYTEEAYAIAQDEAYQGQITVEDDGSRSRNREPRTLPLICWQTMRNACVCWNSPPYDVKGEPLCLLCTIFASC